MGLVRRTFTRDVKMAAVQRLETGASIAEVARAFEVNPNVLHRWRREFRQGPGNAFPGFGKRRWDDTQQAKLERKIGQQTLEIDFLKGCLQRIEVTADVAGIDWKAAIYGNIQEQVRGEAGMSIAEMCTLAELSRAGSFLVLTASESSLTWAVSSSIRTPPSSGPPRAPCGAASSLP